MSVIDICGVLVHARVDKTDRVRRQLEQFPGVEVHAVTDTGRLVVTVEGQEDRKTVDTVSSLLDVDGVLATSLVYQYSDNEQAEQESAS